MKIERKIPLLILAFAVIAGAPAVARATPQGDAARADIQKTFGFVPGSSSWCRSWRCRAHGWT